MENNYLGLIHSIYGTKKKWKCLKCKHKMLWHDRQYFGYCEKCYTEDKSEKDSTLLENWENSFN